MTDVEISHVGKFFGTVRALSGVDLSMRSGEFLAVLGPSGCGKTTLLRCVAGFEQIDEGRIALGGRLVALPGVVAIRSYALSSPGGQRYPQRLEDLVLDPRFPFVKRHLRRIYADPLTGEPEWGRVMAGDSIIGVHSLARGKPLKTTLDPELGIADDAQTYEQWIFAVDGSRAVHAQTPRSG